MKHLSKPKTFFSIALLAAFTSACGGTPDGERDSTPVPIAGAAGQATAGAGGSSGTDGTNAGAAGQGGTSSGGQAGSAGLSGSAGQPSTGGAAGVAGNSGSAGLAGKGGSSAGAAGQGGSLPMCQVPAVHRLNPSTSHGMGLACDSTCWLVMYSPDAVACSALVPTCAPPQPGDLPNGTGLDIWEVGDYAATLPVPAAACAGVYQVQLTLLAGACNRVVLSGAAAFTEDRGVTKCIANAGIPATRTTVLVNVTGQAHIRISTTKEFAVGGSCPASNACAAVGL